MGILENLMKDKEYRGFIIKINLEESRFEARHKDKNGVHSHVEIAKREQSIVEDKIDEYWNSRAWLFPKAEEMGIKKGDRMYTAKGEEVIVISTERVPMTNNQIAVRTNEGAMYICADSLSPRNK